jgi:hypothetical protein
MQLNQQHLKKDALKILLMTFILFTLRSNLLIKKYCFIKVISTRLWLIAAKLVVPLLFSITKAFKLDIKNAKRNILKIII